jgi:hypothetical protein
MPETMRHRRKASMSWSLAGVDWYDLSRVPNVEDADVAGFEGAIATGKEIGESTKKQLQVLLTNAFHSLTMPPSPARLLCCEILGVSARPKETRAAWANSLLSSRRRAVHTRTPPPYELDNGLPPFLSEKALKTVAVEYQEGLLSRLNDVVRGEFFA